jgi:quercetin dioxygenase-like cupin family protein
MRTATRWVASAAALAAAFAVTAAAQGTGIKRTVLQRQDVTGAEPKECVFATADIEPGATVGKHWHPGFEVAYLAQGELELLVDGEPPRQLKPGDSYRIEARRPHDARNTGSTPARVVVSYVVEKGQPLATPVK